MSVHDADTLHQLRRKFEEAAATNEDGVQCIVEPGFAGLVVLFANEKGEVDKSSLHDILVTKNWETKSFTWEDVHELHTTLSSAVCSGPALSNVQSSHVACNMTPSLEITIDKESERALLEPNRELKQLLVADCKVPQRLMHVMNLFAVVASRCNSLVTTNAYLEKQMSTEIEKDDFMSKIVALVAQEGLTWEYICGCDTLFKDYAKMLWEEWILLIKLKSSKIGDAEATFRHASRSGVVPDLQHAGTLLRATRTSLEAASIQQNVVSNSTAQSSAMQSLMDEGLFAASTHTLKTPQWLSALAVLTEQPEGTAWKFQGILFDFDEETRMLTFPNNDSPKRARSQFPSCVRNVKCLDSTGPANLILWSESCEDFERALQATVMSSPEIKKWFLTVERFRVNNLVTNSNNGNILTPLPSMHSITPSAGASTTIAITTTPTSPFLQNALYTAPRPPYCIMNFQQARTQFVVPFRATLRGTAVDVVKSEFTRNGEPKTSFSLVDPAGAWLNCCAVGARNACSDALAEGSDLVVYHVLGRSSLQGAQQPCVWLFNDATIVRVGTSSVKKLIKIDLVTVQK